jgi:hypothetical protein
MSVSGDGSEHESWDFAGTMDFTANATCTAVNEVNVKGKGKAHPRTGHEVPEWKQRYSSTLSLTSALDEVGGERHAPTALPLERSGTHCRGGWVGPTTGLDGCGKSYSQRDLTPGSSSA